MIEADKTFGVECQEVIDEAMRQAALETAGEDFTSQQAEAIRMLSEWCVGWRRMHEKAFGKISAGYVRRSPGERREPE
jgi:hypothetical protein